MLYGNDTERPPAAVHGVRLTFSLCESTYRSLETGKTTHLSEYDCPRMESFAKGSPGRLLTVLVIFCALLWLTLGVFRLQIHPVVHLNCAAFYLYVVIQ